MAQFVQPKRYEHGQEEDSDPVYHRISSHSTHFAPLRISPKRAVPVRRRTSTERDEEDTTEFDLPDIDPDYRPENRPDPESSVKPDDIDAAPWLDRSPGRGGGDWKDDKADEMVRRRASALDDTD